MSTYRKWTREEDNILLNNVNKYGSKGCSITAKQLERTISSVNSRYQRKLKDIEKSIVIEEVNDTINPEEELKVSLWGKFKNWIKWLFRL